MPRYFYTAKNQTGETKTGFLTAENTHQLARLLKKDGLILVNATPQEEKKKKGFNISIPFLGRITTREKLMATRNLQVMIGSGLPLSRALSILIHQTKNKRFKKVLLEVREEIKKGRSFSEALSGYPGVFSELFQNMVKVGEEGGMLEDVLGTLSSHMEKEHRLKSKIKGAMIYPAVIITTMIGIGILMLILVVPKLKSMFEELDVELPVTTRFVMALGSFLAQRWYFVCLFVILFVIFFWRFSKTKIGRKIIDTILLKIPVISSLIKKSNSASTIRTLSALLSSGVTMVKSLNVISGTLKNFYFQKAMKEAAEKVKKGASLSECLEPYQEIYPLGVVEMIKVGEETGQTSEILVKLANFFEEEIDRATKNLVSVLEPVLMVIIGAAVGFFAISMIQPMYSMLGGI